MKLVYHCTMTCALLLLCGQAVSPAIYNSTLGPEVQVQAQAEGAYLWYVEDKQEDNVDVKEVSYSVVGGGLLNPKNVLCTRNTHTHTHFFWTASHCNPRWNLIRRSWGQTAARMSFSNITWDTREQRGTVALSYNRRCRGGGGLLRTNKASLPCCLPPPYMQVLHLVRRHTNYHQRHDRGNSFISIITGMKQQTRTHTNCAL